MASLALSLAYAGMTALSLAMDRYYRQIWNRAPERAVSVGLRLSGGGCLVLAFAACIAAGGWSIGSLMWFGFLSVAGLALVFMLPYAPRFAAALALVSPVPPLLLLLLDFS